MAAATTNPIQEWLKKPIPKTLWHYTSLQGLLDIVKSKQIFATDIRYLNDREEFVHAQSFVDQVVNELDEKDANGWQARQSVKGFTDGLFTRGVLSPKTSQIFVASFSTAEDQLSQWRAYSRGSSGASLGFDLSSIRPGPTVDSLVVFAECIYDDGVKKDLLAQAINRFAKEASEIWRQTGDETLLGELLKDLMTVNPAWSASYASEELKKSRQE